MRHSRIKNEQVSKEMLKENKQVSNKACSLSLDSLGSKTFLVVILS